MVEQLPDFEVKVLVRGDLDEEHKALAHDLVRKNADMVGFAVHEDGVTWSMKEPYKKYEDIPAGARFYFHLNKHRELFAMLEYYSYAEGDMNGRIIRRGVQL